MNIVLASSSPRRKEILARLNVPFIVDFENIVEPKYDNSTSPERYCEKLSAIKASAISLKYSNNNIHQNDTLIIGADTIVLLDDIVLGKPNSKKEAYLTLNSLSGRNHQVITGVTIIYNDLLHTFHSTTTVEFRELKDANIQEYINSNNPYDKAGSYGIQDYSAIFVNKINGCYDNVVGFPLSRFYDELKKINLSL